MFLYIIILFHELINKDIHTITYRTQLFRENAEIEQLMPVHNLD